MGRGGRRSQSSLRRPAVHGPPLPAGAAHEGIAHRSAGAGLLAGIRAPRPHGTPRLPRPLARAGRRPRIPRLQCALKRLRAPQGLRVRRFLRGSLRAVLRDTPARPGPGGRVPRARRARPRVPRGVARRDRHHAGSAHDLCAQGALSTLRWKAARGQAHTGARGSVDREGQGRGGDGGREGARFVHPVEGAEPARQAEGAALGRRIPRA